MLFTFSAQAASDGGSIILAKIITIQNMFIVLQVGPIFV